jgi:hypothetical protein
MNSTKFHELVTKVVIHKDANDETAQLILNWVKSSRPVVIQSDRSFHKKGD